MTCRYRSVSSVAVVERFRSGRIDRRLSDQVRIAARHDTHTNTVPAGTIRVSFTASSTTRIP